MEIVQKVVARHIASKDHSTNEVIVEYAMRFLFKRKSPATAAKITAERH